MTAIKAEEAAGATVRELIQGFGLFKFEKGMCSARGDRDATARADKDADAEREKLIALFRSLLSEREAKDLEIEKLRKTLLEAQSWLMRNTNMAQSTEAAKQASALWDKIAALQQGDGK